VTGRLPVGLVTHANPLRCTCKVDQVDSPCPNVGCESFLSDMKKTYNYTAPAVIWGFVTANQVGGKYRLSSREFLPSKELIGPTASKQWRVFKCCTCNFLTHAVCTAPGKESVMAVVCNIVVEHTKGKRSSTILDRFSSSPAESQEDQ